MVLTLYLISANVYNSVDAPHSRGFSYIELWMLGSQCPILLALCEYGFVLYLMKIAKKIQNEQMIDLDEISNTETEEELENRIKRFDFTTMICSFIFFITFASLYWIILLWDPFCFQENRA